jgi:hypothetical protein
MKFVRDAFESLSGAVARVFDTRSVLKPNARTKAQFAGHVIGHFRRTGPNAWDDYELVPHEGDPIDVYPSVEVQVEPERSRFRMRARGQVLMVQWVPGDDDRRDIDSGADVHALFRERCVEEFRNQKGIGVAAFVARTLRR